MTLVAITPSIFWVIHQLPRMSTFITSPPGLRSGKEHIEAETDVEAACKYLVSHSITCDLLVREAGCKGRIVRIQEVIDAYPDMGFHVIISPIVIAKPGSRAFEDQRLDEYKHLEEWTGTALIGLFIMIYLQYGAQAELRNTLMNADLQVMGLRNPSVPWMIFCEYLASLVFIALGTVSYPLYLMRKRIVRPLMVASGLVLCFACVLDMIICLIVGGELDYNFGRIFKVVGYTCVVIWLFVYSERAKYTFVK